MGRVEVGVVAVGDWDWDWDWDWEMGEGAREEGDSSAMVFRNWRKGWVGWVVLGRRLSRRVADTVRHSNGSDVVRRRKARARIKITIDSN